jgi:hypothetical protein
VRSRLATVACFLALAVTLWVAALHRHAAVTAAGSDGDSAACAYCTGGYAASAPVRFEPIARLWIALTVEAPPAAPVVRSVLPLAHSGNAPPRSC